MKQVKTTIQKIVFETIKNIAEATNSPEAIQITFEKTVIETPPKPELGDIAFPMFPYAKILKKSPNIIAIQVAEILSKTDSANKYRSEGPYLNVKIGREAIISQTIKTILKQNEDFGRSSSLTGRNIMVEFSCPNTNKPLHLGHMRNDSIGESISQILKFNGAQVKKVNLINDRGIHICKSMLAYKERGNSTTPQSENIKSDHFVGKYYVEYGKMEKEDLEVEQRVRDMLVAWEKEDPATRQLWKTMNKWAVDGIEETYKKTGISFDKIYYESETYQAGREEVLKGLEKGVFYKDDQGTVWIDLEDIKLDKKVLLRGDGTTLYLTQDIGTAIARHSDWSFDTLVYVVASEQQYHFKVLFHILKKLDFKWSENLYHLAYGMVNLPDGKMKSREGKVVDADDLFKELAKMAKEEIKSKEREELVEDLDTTAENIALGALNYFLLAVNPMKDMIFNPAESLSFSGNTGPYLQYMGARISSILRKYGKEIIPEEVDFSLLETDDEWEIVKMAGLFPEVVEEAGKTYNPSVLTSFIYELAKIYSKYYHDNIIINSNNPQLTTARTALCKATGQVFKNCFKLLGVPFLESM